ncbi:Hypothetical predicted protein [Prunus dulcis]|uniref:Uncharacterized protein n=1 Tax=Prunus dulcis TaxID=3755 RepID=A0A5E4FD39_PRUDU|nr:Hypothetical predicted protein [Prunus dulcis]
MPIADEVPSPVIPLSDKASCSGANKLQSPIVSHQDDNVDPIEPQEDVKITRETFILHEDILQRGAMQEIGATVIATYIEWDKRNKNSSCTQEQIDEARKEWAEYIGNVQNMQVLDIAGSV